jgi:serine/threonine protein kinase
VAIKILDKEKIQTRNMGAQIKKEISIMKMINHHHVVAVKDVFATSAKIFIVLEFVGGGELFDKIANESFNYNYLNNYLFINLFSFYYFLFYFYIYIFLKTFIQYIICMHIF